MKLYAENTTDNLLRSKWQEIKQKIEGESESYVLNVGETQYVQHL
jgi:hypothetical protein